MTEYKHFIALGSSYTLGRRVAFHCSGVALDNSAIQRFKRLAKDELVSSTYAIHEFATGAAHWESVVAYDSFFEGVYVYSDFHEFVKVLKQDERVRALDVAKLLLSKCKMSHLKLQKMLYFVYVRYLLQTGESLFDEAVVAFKYGPVVLEVYEHYAKYGSDVIALDIPEVVAQVRFHRVSDWGRIMTVVDEVIEQFGRCSPFELVELTHQRGTPWQRAYSEGYNQVITDDSMLRYHEV